MWVFFLKDLQFKLMSSAYASSELQIAEHKQ